MPSIRTAPRNNIPRSLWDTAAVIPLKLKFRIEALFLFPRLTVFALAVMEYAVGVSKFGKNPKTLLVHQY